jgi:hypothetical protein
MLSKKKQSEIALYCYAAVGSMFAGMHNPTLRGAKFTWEKFPAMMERHCRECVATNVVMSDRIVEACRDHAAKTAREIAEHWVKEMTE